MRSPQPAEEERVVVSKIVGVVEEGEEEEGEEEERKRDT